MQSPTRLCDHNIRLLDLQMKSFSPLNMWDETDAAKRGTFNYAIRFYMNSKPAHTGGHYNQYEMIFFI